MARWAPQNNIGKDEHIGRRLFNEPMLIGAQDQPQWHGLQLYHFEESRDREISMDRMGHSGLDKKVIRYLKDRCEHDAKSRKPVPRFDGWVWVKAQKLTDGDFPVTASPIVDTPPASDRDLSHNIYHAHVMRASDSEIAAYRLRTIFTKHGGVHEVPKADEERGIFSRIKRLISDSLEKVVIRLRRA